LDSLIQNGTQSESIQKYYSSVYKAEHNLTKRHFTKAAKIYNHSFESITHPFEIDLINALKSELLSSQNKNNIKTYIGLLIKKGYDKDTFFNDSLLLSLDYWDEIKQIIDTTLTGINPEIQEYLLQLVIKDQDYRMQCDEKYNGNSYNIYTIDSIEIIDSLNYESLLAFLEKTDNISEENLGNFSPIGLILIHNKHRAEIYEPLYNSVIKGDLDVRFFINYLQNTKYRFNNTYVLGNESHGGEDNCLIYRRITNSKNEMYNINKINKYRKLLYCESIQDYHKKKARSLSNNSESFYCYTNEKIWSKNKLLEIIYKSNKNNNRKIYYKDSKTKKQLLNDVRAWKKNQKKLNKENAE
jgi:hypothetical protein